MINNFIIVTPAHNILDPIVAIVSETLNVPKDELPLQVELRVKVANSFNEYLLSLLTNIDDEENMMSTVEKLLNMDDDNNFWAILEESLGQERGQILAGYLKNFN